MRSPLKQVPAFPCFTDAFLLIFTKNSLLFLLIFTKMRSLFLFVFTNLPIFAKEKP